MIRMGVVWVYLATVRICGVLLAIRARLYLLYVIDMLLAIAKAKWMFIALVYVVASVLSL